MAYDEVLAERIRTALRGRDRDLLTTVTDRIRIQPPQERRDVTN